CTQLQVWYGRAAYITTQERLEWRSRTVRIPGVQKKIAGNTAIGDATTTNRGKNKDQDHGKPT
ncbi:MAG TPA: hypothetical protein VM656_10750, partial [Pyrinomonadaceae bacterium]|nr:hypothetical protein [Pyrinomonadaceae bacterium]